MALAPLVFTFVLGSVGPTIAPRTMHSSVEEFALIDVAVWKSM
jgi:hypothetical protein